MGDPKALVLQFLRGGAAAKRKAKEPKSPDREAGKVVRFSLDVSPSFTNIANGRAPRAETGQDGDVCRKPVPEVTAFFSGIAKFVKQPDVREAFTTFLMRMNTTAYWVEVLNGQEAKKKIAEKIHQQLRAQTGLNVPQVFARTVNSDIRLRMASTSPDDGQHIFFLYHPDTNWHGEFFQIAKGDPLPPNFLGMSENLDAIVIWMLFVRQHLVKSARKARFHLIIPAYQTMLVEDRLVFPKGLYPLTIHGVVHDSEPHVWFDLPTIANVSPALFELHHIGNLAKPESEWRESVAMAAGFAAGATTMVAGAVVATALCPPVGAALLISSAAAAKAAHDAVNKSFERPPPRVLGEKMRGYNPEDFDFHYTTRGISTNNHRRGSRGRRP